MHCLYCDRPLALLQRLTGDGEFCSKEHRKIYQREHNQLALERLLESQPGSNRKSRPTPAKRTAPVYVEPEPEFEPELLTQEPEVVASKTEFVAPGPEPLVEEPVFHEPPAPIPAATENLPQLAQFVASSIDKAPLDGAIRSDLGEPLPNGPLPVATAPLGEWAQIPSPRPKIAVFQPGSPDALGLECAIRQPANANFGDGIAPRLEPDLSAQEFSITLRLKRADFVPPSHGSGQALADKIARAAAEPRWKTMEPVLAGQCYGRIVFVLGSLLSRPVRIVPGQDGVSEIHEIRLQPISFPPLPPRMACLEERLHRTDRIGFSPP